MPSEVTRRGFLGTAGSAAMLGTGTAAGRHAERNRICRKRKIGADSRHLLQPAQGQDHGHRAGGLPRSGQGSRSADRSGTRRTGRVEDPGRSGGRNRGWSPASATIFPPWRRSWSSPAWPELSSARRSTSAICRFFARRFWIAASSSAKRNCSPTRWPACSPWAAGEIAAWS